MAGIGDILGRVVITDAGATATLNKIKKPPPPAAHAGPIVGWPAMSPDRQVIGSRQARRRWTPSGTARSVLCAVSAFAGCSAVRTGLVRCHRRGGPEGRSRGSFLPGLHAKGHAQPCGFSRDRDFRDPGSDSGFGLVFLPKTHAKPGRMTRSFRHSPSLHRNRAAQIDQGRTYGLELNR